MSIALAAPAVRAQAEWQYRSRRTASELRSARSNAIPARPLRRMDVNFALEDYEIARGFVLCCQSYPVTDKVVVDFDQTA